jgi:hypothetical protein
VAQVNPLLVVLAEVKAGYTGDVQVTVGATTATVTSRASESPLSIMLRVQLECTVVHSPGWSFFVDSAGKINLQYPATFSLTATGTTEARLGLSGTISGSSEYVFGSAMANPLVPDRGAALDGANLALSDGGSISDGSNARAPWMTGTSRTLSIYDDAADLMAHQALLDEGGIWDLVMPRAGAAPHPTRFRVRKTWRDRPMAISSEWRLFADVIGVSR